MQPVSRLSEPVTDNYGNDYPTGTAVPKEQTSTPSTIPFSTARIPSSTTGATNRRPACISWCSCQPAVSFDLMRQADVQFFTNPPSDPGTLHGPFNQVLQTTHRQNFLVPLTAAPIVSLGRIPRLKGPARRPPVSFKSWLQRNARTSSVRSASPGGAPGVASAEHRAESGGLR